MANKWNVYVLNPKERKINMLTEKDYCDYETCVALKELGFNTKCHGYYESLKRCFNTTSIKRCWCNSEVNDIGIVICPTLYEAQKWLREEKGIGITIFHNYYHDTREMYYQVELYNTEHYLKTFGEFSDWTQALSEGIKEAVKVLKEK